MKSILEQIYWGDYSPDDRPLSDREKAANALEWVWRDAQERLGFEAADALRTGYWSRLRQDSADDFREGFRLGVALMLEALGGR